MSRIGKQPVPILSGVEATFEGGVVGIKGPKGALSQEIDSRISVEIDAAAKEVRFGRGSDEPKVRALHGLYRALVMNMVTGVTTGYQKRLEVHGVGYQCQVIEGELSLAVGFSHTVDLPIPAGLEVKCPNNTTIDVMGVDKQLVGQFASMVRASKPVEPYKGKGVRYAGEHVKRKAGKSMAAGG